MRICFTFIFLILLYSSSVAQDLTFARKTIDTLTSSHFWGRGYTKDGMQKTADFLAHQFKTIGIQSLSGSNYFQQYTYPVNTFPGSMKLMINGVILAPGKDFLIGAASKGIQAQGTLTQQDSTHFTDSFNRVVVNLEKKLTWTVAQKQDDYTTLHIDHSKLKSKPLEYSIHVESKFIKQFKASNICGVVKGTLKPDSVILITAHYDHLGGMGAETYFPGANDNASGVSMLLNLAKYYAAKPQKYSMAFICFSGEEAGLLGSKYFAENPLIELNKIRFLINLDLTGTGNEGITVVNGSEFKSEFLILNELNKSKNYFVKINSRGKAANSDHYWFSQKQVPSFFIYTLGGINAYHDIYDVSATLPLSSYENLFKLITEFNSTLMGKAE